MNYIIFYHQLYQSQTLSFPQMVNHDAPLGFSSLAKCIPRKHPWPQESFLRFVIKYQLLGSIEVEWLCPAPVPVCDLFSHAMKKLQGSQKTVVRCRSSVARCSGNEEMRGNELARKILARARARVLQKNETVLTTDTAQKRTFIGEGAKTMAMDDYLILYTTPITCSASLTPRDPITPLFSSRPSDWIR